MAGVRENMKIALSKNGRDRWLVLSSVYCASSPVLRFGINYKSHTIINYTLGQGYGNKTVFKA
jgi:hypothetical protein